MKASVVLRGRSYPEQPVKAKANFMPEWCLCSRCVCCRPLDDRPHCFRYPPVYVNSEHACYPTVDLSLGCYDGWPK